MEQMNLLPEIPVLLLIIAICYYHRYRFKNNLPTGPLFHFFWSGLYFLLAFAYALIRYHSWALVGVFTLERFVFYNTILNVIRKEKFFYLHAGKNGSWWDDLELGWAKAYPWIWAASALTFLIIQFFL
jgi:hypothetical protein